MPSSTSVPSFLDQLDKLDPNSPEATCFINDSVRGFASTLDVEEDVQKLIDGLDQRLDSVTMGTHFSRRYLRALKKVCGMRTLVPSCYMLSTALLRMDSIPTSRGGFSDVFEGMYDGKSVAVKVLRRSKKNYAQFTKAFCKEAIVWKRLRHENIAYLFGVFISPSQLYMVSEWMVHGNIKEYLEKHPHADRLQLTFDVVKGLEFLHCAHIVHADLKSNNILINNSHRACLTDFGLTHIITDPATYKATISHLGGDGTYQWMAPELLDPGTIDSSNIPLTAKSDIYALSMVVIEMFTGDHPFPGHNIYTHYLRLSEGVRPDRPTRGVELGLSDGIWELIQACWEKESNKRPETSYVVTRMQELVPRLSIVQRFARFDPVSKSSVDILQSTLDSPGDIEFASRLRGNDARVFIDIVDRTMNSKHARTGFVKQCHRVLIKICGRTGLVPHSYVLSGQLILKAGSSTEVSEGKYDQRRVAIKRYAVHNDDNARRVCKEAVILKRLSHPNVVGFFGVSVKPSPVMCLVSEWVTQRPVINYLKSHPDADRIELARSVISGLRYIHSVYIVHGNLNGKCILVCEAGQAHLCDFGFACHHDDPSPLSIIPTSSGAPGTWEWIAPELLDPAEFEIVDSTLTTATDTYALATVLFEIFTGMFLLETFRHLTIAQVVQGARPGRPKGELMKDKFWELIGKCWDQKPGGRPSVSSVLDEFPIGNSIPSGTIGFESLRVN